MDQLTKESFLSKEFDSSNAVWFKKSHSFLLLEEPANFVLKEYASGTGHDELTEKCVGRYGHLEEDIPRFVNEIIGYINYYNNPANKVVISQKDKRRISHYFPPAKHDKYNMGGQLIFIAYGSEDLQFAIHPLYKHLVSESTESPLHKIECYESGDKLVSVYNGQIHDVIKKENIEYFTGGVRQLLYSILFQIEYESWLCMLHASGVANHNGAILFSAASGKGKSTISAILKAHGYHYVADDQIAIDKTGKAYPFPAAISVKQGSLETLNEYYPELIKQEEKETFIGKKVRYIPVYNNCQTKHGYPVRAFVFVNYSTEEPFLFREVEKKQALQLLLEETWVNPREEYVKLFFEWMENTSFYLLQYKNNQDAILKIESLLG